MSRARTIGNIFRIMKDIRPAIDAGFMHQWDLELIFIYPTDQFEHIDNALHLPGIAAIVRVDGMLDRDARFDMTITRNDAGNALEIGNEAKHPDGLFRVTIENLRYEAL